MLADLGYYNKAIDGLYGPATQNAMVTYAQTKGIAPIMVEGSLNNAVCEALQADWMAKQGAAPLPPGVPPPPGTALPPPAPPPPAAPPPSLVLQKLSPALLQSLAQKVAAARPGAPPPAAPPRPAYVAPPKGTADRIWGAMWGDRSTGERIAIGLGAAALLGGVGYLLFAEPKPAARPAAAKAAATPNPKGRSRQRPGGTFIITHKGRRLGHHTYPKRYRKLGFTKKGYYAWPFGLMYPIGDAKHTRAAASYFGKNKHLYPPVMRRVIAQRIDRAKKHFGIGEYRGKVKAHRGKKAFPIRKATQQAARRLAA
jgi:peptidoglycan hydrolase-like protein with peptidoglycan-binding domain